MQLQKVLQSIQSMQSIYIVEKIANIVMDELSIEIRSLALSMLSTERPFVPGVTTFMA